jgi:hypothetical protein
MRFPSRRGVSLPEFAISISRSIAGSAYGGSAGIDGTDAQPEERLQSEGLRSSLIASRASSVDRKGDTDPGATREPKAFKRDIEGRTGKLRNPQRQSPITPTRQRYEQISLGFVLLAALTGFAVTYWNRVGHVCCLCPIAAPGHQRRQLRQEMAPLPKLFQNCQGRQRDKKSFARYLGR